MHEHEGLEITPFDVMMMFAAGGMVVLGVVSWLA